MGREEWCGDEGKSGAVRGNCSTSKNKFLQKTYCVRFLTGAVKRLCVLWIDIAIQVATHMKVL